MSLCGGLGKCAGCKIRVVEGSLSEITPVEQEAFTGGEREAGWRLACQAYPQSACRVYVPPESMSTRQRLQVEGRETDIPFDPLIGSVACRIEPPSLTNPVADAENLLGSAPGPMDFDIQVLGDLSTHLRKWNWSATAHIRDREVIAVSPAGSRPIGLAVDLGSTKIAGYLIDMETGKGIVSQAIMNPQISKGEDIITRINAAIQSSDGRTLLADLAREGIMKLTENLCTEAGVETRDIMDAVIVGNTAMHHLLLDLPVRQLALSPFVPAVRGELNVKARDMGLNFAPGAYVYLPPNIAGFVGGDHVAVLTAIRGEWGHSTGLVIDIGTNTEISLLDRGKITSVSCPSGPTFEGYHIRDGMRAAPGAIEKLYIGNEDIRYKTIDDAPPTGICGSGILDAVSQLYLAGVLDSGGRMLENAHARVVKRNDRLEFLLVPKQENQGGAEISITQKDVREIQLGKAAIQAAIAVLLETEGISEKELQRVIIAGAFGSYIDVSSAMTIGMLPSLRLSSFHQVGNAAGTGARFFLSSAAKRKTVGDFISRVKYLELAGTPEFSQAFTRACLLGPYGDHRH